MDVNAAPKVERVEELRAALAQGIKGEVRFDDGSRALYATDASIYRQVPIGVVIPRDLDDVVATVAICREYDAPVLPRGAGTSLAGQCCNTAVVIDFTKHVNGILEINVEQRYAVVEPGCVLDHLREAAVEHGLTFGPDPATHRHNTLGGMIGNNSCGVHSIMGGRTADNVQALEILTYDGLRMWVGSTSEEELQRIIAEGGRKGEIYAGLKRLRDEYADRIRERYPDIPRRVSGFNLDELLPENDFNVARALVGSEGTCMVVLRARLRLIDNPKVRSLLVLGYEDVYCAGDHVPEVLEAGPIGLEGIDSVLIDYMRRKHMHPEDRSLLPDGKGWLMVEFGGADREASDAKAKALMERLKQEDNPPSMKLFDDPEEEKMLWEVRESGLGATAHVPGEPESHPGWEDAAVPPQKVGAYLRDFRSLLQRFDYDCALYGHFGDGCIHVRIDFDLSSDAGVRTWTQFMHAAADLVLSYGGSLSGEHGDGQLRAGLLPKMFGEPLVDAFGAFKALWDPRGRMNPGKVVDPFPMDSNLRVGPQRQRVQLPTYFAYADDGNSFERATRRCVGVGKCRNLKGGVMCPSFRATHEEKYSTRGRARLLFEMIEADPMAGGWRSDTVRDALDLCLACKGCKGDCPLNVDMATYKAEFMAHHYRHRLHPRSAYSMGLIHYWARAASRLPRLANAALQAPGLGAALKALGGIARQRQVPRFATQTFRDWFKARGGSGGDGHEVLLWPDTFNNYLHPEPLKAATRVLEAAGCRVLIPERPVCCGRPLYAEGMLDLARHQLRKTMDTLAPLMTRQVPLVGLEPSCISSFRDELAALFPGDGRATYLNQNSFMLSDYLDRKQWQPPKLHGKALVQAHCHHHAVMGVGGERHMLERLGLDFELLDAGCCGLAGSFGFQAEHYDVSLKIAEHQMLPKIRAASADTLIVSNGFSCRQQIEHCTGREVLGLAELMDRGLSRRD